MKKRIFIAIQYLEIGGAERSLIGLLNALDYSKYEVDLFVYRHTGEFMKYIPLSVNLISEISSYAAINKPIVEILKQGHFKIALARLFAKSDFRKFLKENNPSEGSAIFQYVADRVTPYLPDLSNFGMYDLAISFLTPHNIVRDKVIAKKKLAWIHTDYSVISVDTKKEFPVWNAFDQIMAVSDDVRNQFILLFPELAKKTNVMENIIYPR